VLFIGSILNWFSTLAGFIVRCFDQSRGFGVSRVMRSLEDTRRSHAEVKRGHSDYVIEII